MSSWVFGEDRDCVLRSGIVHVLIFVFFFFSSRRRHTRCSHDWSSDVCSSDLEAGRASGASALRVMAFHVLPQCVAPYLVLATTHLGVAIVIEAALGFLGVGVPPPTPTWGNMLADSITALVPPWWLAFFPGLAITVTVLA